jgi:hypothetical protein
MVAQDDAPLAPRRAIDARTVVGLFSNQKANADLFLDRLGALLAERYDGIEFLRFGKNATQPADFTHEFLNRCHVVAAAFGD